MRSEIISSIQRKGVLPALGGHGLIEQDPEELADFILFLRTLGVKKYLEIGTSRGALLDYMVGNEGLDGWGINLFKPDYMLGRVYVGDCNSQGAIEFARFHSPYDLVLIDADHHYESIDRDKKRYAPFATKAVAFHDICGLRECEGARRHWQETKNATAREFINPQNSVGIGVILKENK